MISPMSVEEARALVDLVAGGIEPMPQPQNVLRNRPLHELYKQLGYHQRMEFHRVMDRIWPKPQRNQSRPRDVYGFPTGVANWNDAWARALAMASQVRKDDGRG